MHSLEEICRELLCQACDDGLVKFNRRLYPASTPLDLTSGDICGMANLLGKLLRENQQERSPAPSDRL
jgi:hypothetical protein